MRSNFIRQHDEHDCGAACFAMISAYYRLKLPISKCRELTKTDRTGTNLYGLVDAAKHIGLKGTALSGSPEELIKSIQDNTIEFPFIAHIASEGTMLHFVVIFGLKNRKLLIGDPGKGKLKVPFDTFLAYWTGYIVTFQKTDRFVGGDYTKGGFKKFFQLLKGQYGKLAGVFVLSLAISIIGIMGAFVFEIMIDHFATDTGYYEEVHDEGHNHEASDEESYETDSILQYGLEKIADFAAEFRFHIVFVAIICLYILQAVIQFIRGKLIISISKKIDIHLTLTYYNHIVDLPASSVSMRQTGEYLSRFSDTASIRAAISGVTVTLLLDSVMVIACGIILYMESAQLFVVSLMIVLFYAAILTVFKKPIERSNRRVMEDNAVLQSYFKESIDGTETVKASCANSQIKNTTTKKFGRFIESVVRNNTISLSQDVLSDMVELLGTAIILWIGFSMVLSNQITIGALMTFYVLLAYFTQPIKNLVELQPTIQTAFVAADRLNDILDLQQEEQEESNIPLPTINKWDFQNVAFRYGNQELVLQDISLSVHRGEKVAIVGESGSGKTTLAKLLLRFYDPEAGKIELDGTDIRELSLASPRQSIAYVDQNTFLFSDTIRNNLKLGNPDISDEEMKIACRASYIDEYISQLPMEYNTPLNENGANLSGGQRQRLAIARALLRKPQLLIFDEATSNLDTITETSIRNAIFSIDNRITCIVIAHRLTTIRNCDRIYVMEQGKIVEQGTHEELIKLNRKYAMLWNNQ